MPKVLLGDVARERKETCKGSKAGYPIVGLEHLVPEEITLTAWSEDSENTFSKMFHKGDVLFGRRRAYLKKAAVAPFDGICSGDITVIEANAERIIPELLPFIIQNDALFDFAVGKSAGSLSPRVKWEHLKNYEFELPEMDKQRELAELLWAMDATRKSYQELITATDELVKSQFMEQFGSSGKYKAEPLSANVEEMFIGPFGSALKNSCFVEAGQGYCMVYEQKHAIQKSMNVETRYVDEAKYKELQRFTILPGDIIVSCRGTIGEVFLVPEGAPMGIMHPSIMKIRLRDTVYNRTFFVFALENYMKEHIAEANGTGVKMAVTATTLGKERFLVPPMQVQEDWMAFVHQSDKSKFELEQALSELTATYKSIISENLG